MAATQRIVDVIRHHDIDVVITNTSVFPWAALAASLSSVRHLWLLHEFPRDEFEWLADKYDFIADNSSPVLCASPSLAAEVANRVSDAHRDARVSTFRPFSDVATVQLAPHATTRLVVIGSVNRRKNQSDAIEALAQLRDSGQAPQLLLIGGVDDAEYESELRSRARALEVAEQVEFRGHVDAPWSLISPADIVLQCSITEVFSLVACEGAQLGVRMILSRNASSSDISAAVGGIALYEAGNTSLLASIIAEMLSAPERSLRSASEIHDAAATALSRQSSHKPILDEIEAGSLSTPSTSRHFADFVGVLADDADAELTILRSRVQQSTDYIHGLTLALAEQASRLDAATAELETIRGSRRWKLAERIAAPLGTLRGNRS